MKNNKGSTIVDFTALMIIFFVCIIAGGLIWYTFDQLGVELKADEDLAPYADRIDQGLSTFTILNWGSVAIFVAMILSTLISSYFIGSHPVFFVIHSIVLLVLAILGGMISNAYYDFAQDPTFGTYYTTKMPLPTSIAYRFPTVIVIVGFISIVLLAAKWASARRAPRLGGALPGE